MAVYYVDLTSGSNANPGSEASPFLNFQPLNDGSLWDGNEVRVKRGTSGTVNSATRANIVAASGCLLTDYGDAAAPLPKIDGGGTAFNPVWLRSGAGITVEKIHVTRAAASGIMVAPIAGATLSNVIVRDVLVTENTQNNTQFGSDGVQVGGFPVADAGTVSNVLLQRITARDNGGHGFKVRGRASNVRVLDSVSLRSGKRTPAHAMGTAGHFCELNRTSTGNTDIRSGWTNPSGTIFKHVLSAPGVVTSITSWFAVYIAGAGAFGYYKLPYSATPLTPGVGECGSDAANTVLINLGGAIAPTELTTLYGIFARPENVEYRNCVGAYTYDVNPTGTPIEGQGVYFDNGSYRCNSFQCVAFGNAGHGFFLNDPTDCGHYQGTAYDNGKGAACVARGDGTNIFGCVLSARPGTDGIYYNTGNQRAFARRNQIIGALRGMASNDTATNDVTEDENIYVNCTTRTEDIANTGARSSDRTLTRVAGGNADSARAIQAAAAAELVA